MFGDIYRGKRIVVTGHTGFKGSWLSHWLTELGAEVWGIAEGVPTTPSFFEVTDLEQRVRHHICDIRDLSATKRLIVDAKPDFVFHLAAQALVSVSYSDPVSTIATNALGTVHILESLRGLQTPCTAVFITSDKCYDNVEWCWGYRETDRLAGKDIYSASKSTAEILIRSYVHSFFQRGTSPIRLVSVRAGNVIGGGDWAKDRIVPDIFRAWARGNPVMLRNPASTRPWQHVLEPLGGYLRAGQVLSETPALHGESYNFGPSGEQDATVLELVNELAKHWSVTKAPPRGLYQMTPGAFHEAALLKLNCDKALRELRWYAALPLEKNAELTAKWYSEFYGAGKQGIAALSSAQIAQYAAIAKTKGLPWAN